MAVAPVTDSCSPLFTGGYDCDFVEPPPDSLQCPVCLLPFRDPNLLSCCGHKGCGSCISRIKAAGHPCPMCQQPFDTMLDKHFQRKVLDLRVYCSKKGEGCVWEGELRHLQTHSQRDCGHVEEECRYKCGGRYQRRLLKNHEMDECPQRSPEVITQRLMMKIAERVDKLEAAYHEDQVKLTEQIKELKKENTSLQSEKCNMNRKMHELEERLQEQAQQEKLMSDELEAKHTELLSSIRVAEKIHQEDQTKLASVQSKLASVEEAHRNDQAKLNQEIQQLQKENIVLQDERKEVTRKVDELEEQIQHQSKHLLSLVPAHGTLSSLYPPCEIIMPQFSQHKRDEYCWYSQPFYSAPGGYKLCLAIAANGGGDGAGTHVTVFVCLMKGENDKQLKWPFEHEVTYGILNWKRDANHVIVTTHFKKAPKECKARVMLKRQADGWSNDENDRLLPHSSLYSDAARNIQYLKEDCLCLQVVKVEPPK